MKMTIIRGLCIVETECMCKGCVGHNRFCAEDANVCSVKSHKNKVEVPEGLYIQLIDAWNAPFCNPYYSLAEGQHHSELMTVVDVRLPNGVCCNMIFKARIALKAS